MRLGLIGPSQGNLGALRERAQFVIDELRVDRAVYLGVDGALDEVVQSWATEIVAGEPSDAAVWHRAAETCSRSDHKQLDDFVRSERKRSRLKVLECLAHRHARTVEIFDGIVAVIIYDKGLLDEEDMLPASVLIFGRSADPIIKKVGPRTFVSPGPAAHAKGGVALLVDEGASVRVSIYGPDGREVIGEAVTQMGRVGRMTVQGTSS